MLGKDLGGDVAGVSECFIIKFSPMSKFSE